MIREVMVTERFDQELSVTVATDYADHRFTISIEKDHALIQHEETMHTSGFVTGMPEEEIWRAAATDDQITEWLDEHNLESIRREIRTR